MTKSNAIPDLKTERSLKSIPLNEAWNWVTENFPFAGYIPPARKDSYFEMPKSVAQYLDIGASILDFGAGPCDKTAMLALVGFQVTAYDDMGDDWYNLENNQNRILNYASEAGIKYVLPDSNGGFLFPAHEFDAVILNNVVEHLHDSPKQLLNILLESVKPGGLIFIDVPNAANLRKRIDILRGRTNYPSFESFYWSSYPWRGHVREYVKDDLLKLGKFLGLETLEINTHHYHLDSVGPTTRIIFKAICRLLPSLRESWMFIGRKPENWVARNQPNNQEASEASKKQYFKRDKQR